MCLPPSGMRRRWRAPWESRQPRLGSMPKPRHCASKFEATFWCEELSTYALALDGEKRPCRVVASNAGHALLTGIAAPDRAERVADTLMRVASFSGWGVRTVARTAARYNPISYHNGSVWPHDNALIALGCARYGLKEPVLRILPGLFDAACHWDPRRLPELFCGFARRQSSADPLSGGLLAAGLGKRGRVCPDRCQCRVAVQSGGRRNPVRPTSAAEVPRLPAPSRFAARRRWRRCAAAAS